MDQENCKDNIQIHQSAPLRLLFLALGIFFVCLGFVGIFLPILPTTPFMLLAAACFARSSHRFYRWLTTHMIFGPAIRDWRQHRALSRKTKAMAIGLIFVTFGVSIGFFIQAPTLRIILIFLEVTVILFLLSIPTRKSMPSY